MLTLISRTIGFLVCLAMMAVGAFVTTRKSYQVWRKAHPKTF
jgi:hypothetical protein